MTTVVVRSSARELTRVECAVGAVALDSAEASVVEAESHAGTVLYRGHVQDAEHVTLRFVGGRPDE